MGVVHPVMEWLAAGLPLSLLMDLAGSDEPGSDEILRAETARGQSAESWLTPDRFVPGLASY